ncbi:MAG: hypothetical protein HKN19_13945, partial [Halioglobus sp.]|nr:hypothetical protein [Halioglobus sp.]
MSTRIVMLMIGIMLVSCAANEQQALSPRVDGPNVVLITIDGLRWQEVFNGADAWLLGNPDYMHNLALMRDRFWHNDRVRRRELLMPFLWRKFGVEGQVYGNRAHNCAARVRNNMWFSYPGYNEMLVGYPDDFRIASNSAIDNPNVTVLEYLNRLPELAGRVAGAAMWDPIGNAVNENRSGVTMRTSVESIGVFPGAALPALLSDLGDSGKSIAGQGGLSAGSALSGA